MQRGCIAIISAVLFLVFTAHAYSAPPLELGCLRDCAGHSAGYEWARQKGLTGAWQCTGKSWSFIEGCETYIKQSFWDRWDIGNPYAPYVIEDPTPLPPTDEDEDE